MNHISHIAYLVSCILALTLPLSVAAKPKSLKWNIQRLTIDGNEGIDIADFNNDGKLDIIAGRNWYSAPDYKPRPVRTIEDWNGYVESNGDFAYDVNGDGFTDVLAWSFLPTTVYWYDNPGTEALELGKMWPKHLLVGTKSTRNEGVTMHDLDGEVSPDRVDES